jgi:hypothetical protein
LKFNRFIYSSFLFLLLINLAKPSNAQYSEYEIKAAYIFNFAKFVVWPESSGNNDTILLGIYGTDPFGNTLEKTLIGRKAQGKDWKIIRSSNINNLVKCQILFISDVGKYETITLFERTKGLPILTIGDELIDFCELGGIVNFTSQFSEQQFEINNESAKSKGIVISPKLLLLAKIISNKEDEF